MSMNGASPPSGKAWDEWLGYLPFLNGRCRRALSGVAGQSLSVADVRGSGGLPALLALEGVGMITATRIIATVFRETHLGETHWSPSRARWLTITACGLWQATVRVSGRGYLVDGTLADGLIVRGGTPMCSTCRRKGNTARMLPYTTRSWVSEAVDVLCRRAP